GSPNTRPSSHNVTPLDSYRSIGKAERLNRTLLDEWAYNQPYTSEAERRRALPQWLHTYNHHRGHTALGGHPPASRVPNLTGQNS
ncbi:integrase core domain-containing protein, partial [Actinomadura coerulea]|uniref:integrase core domain-containing protein n=1 Tax=Actinomadura coerulea TaxID=46159 RepID=UPI003428ECB4